MSTPHDAAAATPPSDNEGKLPLTPFPIEATGRILECHHILKAIITHTPRATQSAFLRTSRKMYLLTAPILYRNVHIDGKNMESFFRGALNSSPKAAEADHELGNCAFKQGKRECKIWLPGGKRECKIWHPGDKPFTWAPGQLEGFMRTVHQRMFQIAMHGHDMPVDGTSDEKANDTGDAERSTERETSTECETSTERETHTLQPALPSAKGDTPTTNMGGKKLPNFKLKLLKHVRVLTIGTHHACLCHMYDRLFKALLPNLDIVRVASDMSSMLSLHPLCDSRLCRLLSGVRTRKLVLRSLDGGGLPLWDLGASPTFSELVLFLPMDSRRYQDEHRIPDHSLDTLAVPLTRDHPDVKIVFYPTWEGSIPNEGDEAGSFNHGHLPVTPDDIVYCVRDFLGSSKPKNTICGMGKLRWRPYGDIAAAYKHFFPNDSLSSQRAILDLVRTELRTDSLNRALSPFNTAFVYDPGSPEKIIYKTFNEYLKDEEGRRGEINADD